MSGEYRDELGAAHSRIAELEEKVRSLEDEARASSRAPSDGRFPVLEAEIAKLRKSTDPAANARGHATLTYIGAVFPLLGGMLSYLHQPIAATMCSVVFIAIIAANMYIRRRLKLETSLLAEMEAKLADARRIAELEAKLADTKVRVAALHEEREETLEDHEETPIEPARLSKSV